MAACITDAAYIGAASRQASAIISQATIDAAIQVGAALYQRNASGSIVNMQEQIAERQTRMAERVQAHAEIFWAEERELVDDIFSITRRTEDYLSSSNILGNYADAALAAGRQDWLHTADELCMPAGHCEDARWDRNAQVIRADLISYSARQEEARVQILNDRRYAWQHAMTGLGRGQLSSLMTYQAINGVIAGNLGNIVEGSINSALQAYGFYSANRIQDGWGSGISDSWNVPRMPRPMTPRSEPAQTAPAPVVQPIEPIGKNNEMVEGMRIYDEMQQARRRGEL
jgi:hypothetical protein